MRVNHSSAMFDESVNRFGANLCADGIYATALQLAGGERTGEIRDSAWGYRHDMKAITSGSTFHGYCLTKPVSAVAVLAICEMAGLDIDEPIRPRLDPRKASPELGEIPAYVDGSFTVSRLLNHSLGLDSPSAMDFRFHPDELHAGFVNAAKPDYRPAYSDFLAGWFLEWVCASVGFSLANFVEAELLKSVEFGGEISISLDTSDAIADAQEKLVVGVGGLPHSYWPFLSELLEDNLTQVRPAFGGLVSARALAAFLHMYDSVMMGRKVDGWPSSALLKRSLRAQRGHCFDRMLRREGNFGGGFMLDLRAHGVSPILPPTAIGHTVGYFPGCMGLDVSSGRVFVGLANGMNFGSDLPTARRLIVEAVWTELANSATG